VKLSIEPFTSLTGWTTDGAITASILNQEPTYISGRLAASTIFKVPAGSNGKSIYKTISISLAGYDELVLSIWSQRKAGSVFEVGTDFAYQIAIEGTKAFYLPTYRGFNQVTISIAGITTATKVKITALHNDADYLLLSGLYAVKEEMPLDVMQALVDEIAYHAEVVSPGGVSIGTATTVAGAASFACSSGKFLDRYAVVEISGSAGTETHQIDSYDEVTGLYTLKTTYDGAALLYSQAAAVKLQIPAVFGTVEEDIVVPGVAVWGMAPEPLYLETDVQREIDTYEVGGTFGDRRDDMYLSWPMLIDCESRHNETLALASRIVRRLLGQGNLWVNGRKYDFHWDQLGTDVLPEQVVETLPKVQYTLDVIVRERREDRQTLPKALTATDTVTIETGVL